MNQKTSRAGITKAIHSDRITLYASAFNDVDFSLRVGETGHGIVYAPQAELHHYELQTFASHYEGARAAEQEGDVRRMRARWAGVCADDPFYNPNLSLLPGSDWALGCRRAPDQAASHPRYPRSPQGTPRPGCAMMGR